MIFTFSGATSSYGPDLGFVWIAGPAGPSGMVGQITDTLVAGTLEGVTNTTIGV